MAKEISLINKIKRKNKKIKRKLFYMLGNPPLLSFRN